MNRLRWSKEELEIIKNNLNTMRLKDILKLLPNRTYRSLSCKLCELHLIRDKSITLPRTHKYNQNYWEIPNLHNSFIAGAISADGNIRTDNRNACVMQYQLAIIDECLLDYILQQLQAKTSKKFYRWTTSPHYPDRKFQQARISINCFDRCSFYLKKHYNVTEKKTKRIGPTNLTDINLNLAYIFGYFTGDGHIAYKKPSKIGGYDSFNIGFTSSSKNILLWIKDIFDFYFPYLNHQHSNTNLYYSKDSHCWKYCVIGVRAAIIFDYWSQMPVFQLPRKMQRQEIINYVNNKKLKFPHLFKTFEYNNELNTQLTGQNKDSQNLISQSPILV